MNAKMSKISFSILVAILLALGLALAPLQTARAATCSVTSALDDGSAGTLRAMLADVTCDTITFTGNTTIHLVSELDLTRNVSIDGGTNQVVLSGDNDSDGVGEVRVLDVWDGVTASLNHLTVTKGYTTGTGSGGGIYNAGNLTVTDSTFSGNSADYGGGIFLRSGTVTVTNSTFSGNSASSGGGIMNMFATLAVTNSTFSGNSATNQGGGIWNYDNPGTVTNSIFVKGSGNNCYGTVGGSNNLADDASCGASFTNSSSILLGPLGSYGGATQTIPLLPGSSAIDTGLSASCSSSDQRGKPRVGACDIGAYESQGFSLAISGGDNQTASPQTAFASPLEGAILDSGYRLWLSVDL